MARVDIPDDLMSRVQQLVQEGTYPDERTAVAALLRKGLAKETDQERPRKPWSPRELPPSERPIEPDPTDLKWMD